MNISFLLNKYGAVTVFGWKHISVDLNNTIFKNKITELPLVKAYEKVSGSSVIEGDWWFVFLIRTVVLNPFVRILYTKCKFFSQ
ncbi:hypothetical protein COL21_12570 [Bacillus thuringiensis]|nr:hypothetical protein COL21_12570 [Bacillus thuringiensis]